jgi:serine/threonine-protein kinase
MSPEQLERRKVDRGADVFAFGVILHELLTGRRLFAGADDQDTLRRIRTLAVEPPSRANHRVPAALDMITLRSVARDPGARYQSAAEVQRALERSGVPVASRGELLGCLAALMPTIFCAPCDGCGRSVPCGADCTSCRTQLEPEGPVAGQDAPEDPARPTHLSAVRTPVEGVPLERDPLPALTPSAPRLRARARLRALVVLCAIPLAAALRVAFSEARRGYGRLSPWTVATWTRIASTRPLIGTRTVLWGVVKEGVAAGGGAATELLERERSSLRRFVSLWSRS